MIWQILFIIFRLLESFVIVAASSVGLALLKAICNPADTSHAMQLWGRGAYGVMRGTGHMSRVSGPSCEVDHDDKDDGWWRRNRRNNLQRNEGFSIVLYLYC